MKGRTREEHRDAARSVLKGAGYAKGGDVSQDRSLVTRGVHEHERNMHKGMKLTDLQFKRGGDVKGHKSKSRADRKPRGGNKVKIVVNAAPKDEAAPPMPMPKPIPVPVPMKPPMAGPMPGGPPPMGGPGGPGPALPPPGAPMRAPMPPPPGMPMRKGGAAHHADGGRIKVPQSGPDTPTQRALTSDKNFKRGGAKHRDGGGDVKPRDMDKVTPRPLSNDDKVTPRPLSPAATARPLSSDKIEPKAMKRASGGSAKFPHPMDAGAGSGEGRLEKTADAKKQGRG